MKRKGIILLLVLAVIFLVIYLSRGESATNLKSSQSNPKKISAVVVPHFDFFKDKRQEFLSTIAKDYQPENVVLVSTNHFNIGTGNIISTSKSWKVADGEVRNNPELLNKLSGKNVVNSDETPFGNEHGINNLMPDLKKSFPAAKILPIIIKDQTSESEITVLNDALKESCSDCLLVSSVDFSHYQPNSLAQIHDQYSIAALEKKDEGLIQKAETDSPPTLLLNLKWVKNSSGKNWHLFYNDNSGNVSENDTAETTSTVIGYFSAEESKSAEKTTTFLIGGDMMFDRNVYHNYKDAGLNTIFDKLGNRSFWGVDLAMANLEGPISSKTIDDDYASGSMVFNFPPETVNTLKYMHLNAVSLANNHTLNAGASGFNNTKKVLEAAGIKYAGSQEEFSGDNLMRIEGEIPLSIITLDELVEIDENQVTSMIKEEKTAGRKVMLVPHWGVEYEGTHHPSQSTLAHKWIDAGADLVVGGHPHVTEDAEIYKNRPIIYSLGNFVFDQYFSQETQEGFFLGGVLKQDSISLSFFPFKSVKSQPVLLTGASKAAKIKTILDLDSATGFTKLRSDTIEIKL